jgi:hypothetical protein
MNGLIDHQHQRVIICIIRLRVIKMDDVYKIRRNVVVMAKWNVRSLKIETKLTTTVDLQYS